MSAEKSPPSAERQIPPAGPAITQVPSGSQATSEATRVSTLGASWAGGSWTASDQLTPASAERKTRETPAVVPLPPETATQSSPVQSTATSAWFAARPTEDQASPPPGALFERRRLRLSPTATQRPGSEQETSSSFGPRSVQVQGESSCSARIPACAAAGATSRQASSAAKAVEMSRPATIRIPYAEWIGGSSQGWSSRRC